MTEEQLASQEARICNGGAEMGVPEISLRVTKHQANQVRKFIIS